MFGKEYCICFWEKRTASWKLHTVKKHNIYIKLKSYKLELLKSWSFNMVSKPDLTGGPGYVPYLCNLFPICLFESP